VNTPKTILTLSAPQQNLRDGLGTTDKAGSHVGRCQHCSRTTETRVYRVNGGQHAWCLDCRLAAEQMGADVQLVPEWVERAYRKQLPVNDLTGWAA
jgi:hypothetical protein